MNKIFLLFPVILLLGFLVASCDSTSNPVTPNPVGSILVSSSPSGAQIWVDGSNSGKVTPDSVVNLSTGNHTVTLKLTNYRDTSKTVNVVEGLKTAVSLTLTSDISFTSYGPIKIWESADPSPTDPSGIVLKSGLAVSIGASTYGPVDVYYSSNGYVVATAYGLHNNTGRSTSFYVGSANNLSDGIASPLNTASGWITQVTDVPGNYFFLFDADSHYSKMKVTNRGGGTGLGDPAWVEVQWLYNNKVSDRRF